MVAIRTIVRTPLSNEERRGSPTDADPPEDWRDEEVTRDEMALIFCRPAKAPSWPDGVHGKVLALAAEEVKEPLSYLTTASDKGGFPQ